MTQHEQAGKDGSQTMHKVLLKNYDKLINVLNTSIVNLSKYFVASNLITTEDEDEILNASRDKARLFLYKIEASIKVGFTAGFHIMLDIMQLRGSVIDQLVAERLKYEIDEEYKNEKLEEEKKEVDVKRQEHINSLTLQLKEKSDQKIVVEQLQQKIAEEDARRKQMDQNLDKEKENNRRLYMQYLKTLKEFQNLLGQHKIYFRNKIDYEHDVTKQLNSLKEEKNNMRQYIIELKKQAAAHEENFKEEQQKCKTKDLEISTLTELLQAAELGFKEDDKEWRKDYEALKKECGSLSKSNDELEKEKTTLQQEVDVLKALVEAAEIALKEDDEEWRKDYSKISDENKLLKEEIDNKNENIESLKQEKDTLQTENDKIKEEKEALITEKENTTTVHQSDLDAALLSHKADSEEWQREYQNLMVKYDSLKQENDKLLKQQLEAALIGRRTSIEQLEGMETSLQSTAQEIVVLKVANEEAEREIMLLNNDKSSFDQKLVSLEEQSKVKENELIATNETLNRELMEVRARLANTSEENQRLHQSLSVEYRSVPQQSFYNEVKNLKLQLSKTRAEKEKIHQMYGESLSKANVLQSDLLSTKAQLVLQKELQERDAKLLQMKDKREEELKATIDRLSQKIESLEQDCLKKQTHGLFTVSQDNKLTNKAYSSVDNRDEEVAHPMNIESTCDPMQSLSTSPHQLPTSKVTTKSSEAILSHPVPQTTASLKCSSAGNLMEQGSLVSNSLPSLHYNTSTTALYIRKSVVTAEGEDVVMCKQVIHKTDLFYGQRVIIQMANDKYEYGVVKAFPEYISGKMNIVGIELDLPNGISDGSADNIYYFRCKPNHGLFVPVEKLLRILYKL